MQEERIKLHCPRKIALIGFSPLPGRNAIAKGESVIELFPGCTGWIVEYSPNDPDIIKAYEAILGTKKDNELRPFAMKDVEGCEVELIARHKE